MRKLTALFVASTLAMGAANLAHAAGPRPQRQRMQSQ